MLGIKEMEIQKKYRGDEKDDNLCFNNYIL